MENSTNRKLHNFDLSTFKKAQDSMIATSDCAYNGIYGGRVLWHEKNKEYTEEEIQRIIANGTVTEQIALSRAYFNKDGYYKQIILHYATLLKYVGMLIPNTPPGKKLSTPHIQKKYFAALEYVEKMNLPTFLTRCAQRALVDGCYYGIIGKQCSKESFSIIDLPAKYCMTRFKDCYGNDLIEFDLSYFNTIADIDQRKAALAAYPDFIVKAYRRWSAGKLMDKYIIIPPEMGICFPMMDGRPFFLNIIPATIQYETAVETEQEREREEIRKIIVQEIPHLNDGRLLFEPEEAAEIHAGTVGMIKNNKNTSVLTTYGKVESISSKTAGENGSNGLERMLQNVYSQAGVSGEIFAASGGNTTETSIKYDTAIMMTLANKFAIFVTNIINTHFSNSNINFKYTILPITYHNDAKFADSSFKLAQAGFSLLLPALAVGFSQRDLVNIKDLENDVLKLTEKLIPPQTAYTQTGEGGDNGGRPAKEVEEKKEQTIKNEESIEKSHTQGGTE